MKYTDWVRLCKLYKVTACKSQNLMLQFWVSFGNLFLLHCVCHFAHHEKWSLKYVLSSCIVIQQRECCFIFNFIKLFNSEFSNITFLSDVQETQLIFLLFFLVVVVEFELRTSCLQSRPSTTWATSPVHFAPDILEIGSRELVACAGLNHYPSDLSSLSSHQCLAWFCPILLYYKALIPFLYFFTVWKCIR
jgi:hypothetical protein